MLTVELLKQNQTLAQLTDEQFAAIALMSKNDEASIINSKTSELLGKYDADVLVASGIQKKSDEKSYDYVKRIISDFKSKITGAETANKNLQDKVVELQKIVDEKGDTQLRSKLKDSENTIAQLRTQISENEKKYNDDKNKLEADIKNVHIDYAFDSALSSLNIKKDVTDSIKSIMFEAAKREVLAKYTPDFIENAGKKVLVFRDSAGVVVNNPANNMAPFTALELISNTSVKDIIDSGKQLPGGGTGPIPGQPQAGSVLLDMSSIKTQMEADNAIEQYLLQKGLTRDSDEFAAESIKLRADNKVSELPIR